MRIDEATIIPAAQELLTFIRESEHPSIPAFCEAKGLDRLKVARAIKGEILRVDVDFALDVEEATGGAVPVERWRTDEELRAEIKRRREARAAERSPESTNSETMPSKGAA